VDSKPAPLKGEGCGTRRCEGTDLKTRRYERRAQVQFPGFGGEIAAEAVMLFLVDELKSGLFVKVPGGSKNALRP